MNIKLLLRNKIEPLFLRYPYLKRLMRNIIIYTELIQYSGSRLFPGYTILNPRDIYISLTANCNLRCKSCLYGREFMNGHQLELPAIKRLINDAKNYGIQNIRLYGGEPLLHPDITEIVKYISDQKMGLWLSTNGVLLKNRIDELYMAGLRRTSIGCYGIGEEYDKYVQRKNSFALVEEGIRYIRRRYGNDISLNLNWLLMKPTCTKNAVSDMLTFSMQYNMPVYVNLIHYSLPYFVKGDSPLHLHMDNKDDINDVVSRLINFKKEYPDLMLNSILGLRSIPDWLSNRARMEVPCTENRLLWVGADGTIQVCYVQFKLGNIIEDRLKDLILTKQHRDFANKVYNLKCPNCYCSYDKRIQVHWPSRRYYSRLKKTLLVPKSQDSEAEPLIEFPVSHCQCESIHPFLDGNESVENPDLEITTSPDRWDFQFSDMNSDSTDQDL